MVDAGDEFGVAFPLSDYLPDAPDGRSVAEPARDVPVVAECDVAVLGGGPAGVCAAVAAARAGRRVVLVERHGCLGGMATVGDVVVWHTLYGTDGRTQVIGGLVDATVRRLQAADGVYNTAADGETGNWVICAEKAKFVFDDLAIGSGVRLMLHTLLADVVRDGRRIVAAVVEGKSGRGAVLAETFIDCTGDADLIRRAGAATQVGDADGRCQPPSLCFRVAGVAEGAMSLDAIQAELSKRTIDATGGLYPCFLWGVPSAGDKSEWMLAGTRILGVNSAESADMTRAEVEGRYQLRWVLDQLRGFPGWETCRLVDVAAQVGTRESHRILADHQLERMEVLEGVQFDDAVAQGTYPIDIHTPDGPGLTFEYLNGLRREIAADRSVVETRWDGATEGAPLRETLCYTIPYRSLIPRGLDNALAAGRCAGASHDSMGAIRVMVNCMQLGQAAGSAAALVQGGTVRGINVTKLRERLARDGAPLRMG